jgi:ankyrin repeat protein
MTSLLDAIKNRDYDEVISAIVDCGIDPNYSGSSIRNGEALFWASITGQLNIVHLLLNHGADVNGRTVLGELGSQYMHLAPLHGACSFGHLEIAKLLIDRGANLEAKNIFGRTPLMSSCRFNQLKSIKFLLSYYVDVHVVDKEGLTSLHDAVLSSVTEAVQVLLEAGASIDAKDIRGKTPLHFAAERGKRDMVEILIRNKANLHARDHKGNIPLHYAALQGQEGAFKLLLPMETSLDTINIDKMCINNAAIRSGKIELLKCLVSEHYPVDRKLYQGKTLLHFVAMNGTGEMIDFLIKEGAFVDEVDDFGCTPLHYASNARKAKCILRLYHYGASLRAHDNAGKYAFSPKSQRIHKLEFETVNSEYDEMLELLQTCHGGFEELALRYIPYMKSPLNFLNRFTKNFKQARKRQSDLYHLLESRLQSKQQEATILRFLMKLLNYIQQAQIVHVSEAAELQKVVVKLEEVVCRIFESDAMDPTNHYLQGTADASLNSAHNMNIHRLLVPDSEFTIFSAEDFPRCFQDRSVISYCIQNRLKSLFDSSQIANIIHELYFTTIKSYKFHKCTLKHYDSRIDDWYLRIRYCPIAVYTLNGLCKLCTLGLIFYLTVYHNQSIHEKYFDCFQKNNDETLSEFCLSLFSTSKSQEIQQELIDWNIWEYCYACFLLTQIFHEIGEYIDSNYSLADYLTDEWNYVDSTENLLGSGWLIFRSLAVYYCYYHVSVMNFLLDTFKTFSNLLRYDDNLMLQSSSLNSLDYHEQAFVSQCTARAIFALIAVPLSLGLLRYFSIYKPLGELVIMIRSMIHDFTIFLLDDFTIFLLVYIVPVIGFSIAFHGMFSHLDSFQSFGSSLLSMLACTLGDFDFGLFSSEEYNNNNNSNLEKNGNKMPLFFTHHPLQQKWRNMMGIALLFIFILLSIIILLNLLVARMSNSFQQVSDAAFQEWLFIKAKSLKQLMIWKEKHCFSMHL